MPFLHSSDLSQEKFIEYIKRFPFPEDAYLLAFSPVKAVFDAFAFDEEFLSSTEQGRIFSPRGELKWRRMGKQIRVVYIGNWSPPEGLEDLSSELTHMTSHMTQLILWGKRCETVWFEKGAPQAFIYPISEPAGESGRIAVDIENWMDRAGAIRFSRYHSLKEIHVKER